MGFQTSTARYVLWQEKKGRAVVENILFMLSHWGSCSILTEISASIFPELLAKVKAGIFATIVRKYLNQIPQNLNNCSYCFRQKFRFWKKNSFSTSFEVSPFSGLICRLKPNERLEKLDLHLQENNANVLSLDF